MPSHEMPVWKVIYDRSPWDYAGLDTLHSKTALQIISSNTKLKPGTTINSFMMSDPYESGGLSDEEFKTLSDEELLQYVSMHEITDDQFNSLSETNKRAYQASMSKKLKSILGA